MPEFPESGENIGVLVKGVEFACVTGEDSLGLVLGEVDADSLRERMASGEKLYLRAKPKDQT